MKKYRILVKGLVQGVGYRYYCRRKADEYGIRGLVRNLFNGDVELLAEGHQNLINDFIKDLRTGPSGAHVRSVLVEESEHKDDFKDFIIY